jgi:multidrug resistance efflux pump
MNSSDQARSARIKGLKIAAKVALAVGLVAGFAATAQAEQSTSTDVAKAKAGTSDAADRLAGLVAVRDAKSCGCAPCWGPPAPPKMEVRHG